MSRTSEAAQGKWRGILLELGLSSEALRNRHGPCPMCGGRDRFRWDNRDGNGGFICSQCGSGDGFRLLQLVKGWDFATAAREVDRVVGIVRAEPIRRERSPEQRRRSLIDLWQSARRVTVGDPVSAYLDHRRVGLPQNVDAIRYAPTCPCPGGSQRPAMIARVTGPDGKGATIHRTFLTPQGRKAEMDQPRATMPGTIPDGAAIRLSMHGDRLGIAEGIETALAATARFGVPVWAAINATMLAKWTPPEGVTQVVVFADNDATFTGQEAAYSLAKRLAIKLGIQVDVRMPGRVGADWADADAA